MGKGKLYVPPSHGDVRIIKRFILYLDLPVEDGLENERQVRWLETAYIWQRYAESYSDDPARWGNMTWADKEDYKEQ